MKDRKSEAFIAVAVGNTSMQVGWFDGAENKAVLPRPLAVMRFASADPDWTSLARLPTLAAPWYVASVYREAEERLLEWVVASRPDAPLRRLRSDDFPLSVEVARPERVGADRLAAAVAALALRKQERGAIVVDAGTAITVDAISTRGAFLGGAILPGMQMSSAALFSETDLLPHVEIEPLESAPPALGKDTEAAIRSGLYWGTIGAVRHLVRQIRKVIEPPAAELFLTGGGMSSLVPHIDRRARFVPDLILAGIALTVRSLRQGNAP